MYPLHILTERFEAHRNPENAFFMEKYMKNQFAFFGIQANDRRAIGRSFLSDAGIPPPDQRFGIMKKLWAMKEREYQLFGMELLHRYKKNILPDDIDMLHWIITHKSWWDTVDYIAANLVGHYGLKFQTNIPGIMKGWLESHHLWLQRSTLIFQLKYKDQTDTQLLSRHIHALKHEPDFFVRKAIGWALREYSKTNPQWVVHFVKNVSLAPLSRKEALKWMKNQGMMDTK